MRDINLLCLPKRQKFGIERRGPRNHGELHSQENVIGECFEEVQTIVETDVQRSRSREPALNHREPALTQEPIEDAVTTANHHVPGEFVGKPKPYVEVRHMKTRVQLISVAKHPLRRHLGLVTLKSDFVTAAVRAMPELLSAELGKPC